MQQEGRKEGWRDKLASTDRKSTRLNSSHLVISYAVFCLEKHTSELQSPCNLVCRLLLEKKKTHSRLHMPWAPLHHAITLLHFTTLSITSALFVCHKLHP